MKKLLQITGFIIFIPFVVLAKPDVSIEGQLYSKYPWRGVFFEGGVDLYAEIKMGNFGFGLYQYSMWEENRINQIQIDEIDPSLFYYFQTGFSSVTLALTKYYVRTEPGKKWDNTWEVGIIMEISDLPLLPAIEYYYDFGMFDANYIGINLSHSIIPSLTVNMSAGINDGQWVEETVKSIYFSLSKEFEYYFMNIEFTAGIFNDGKNYPYVIFKIST